MESLSFTYYKDVLFAVKRAKYKGSFINAKPILLLSVFEGFSNGLIYENKICISEGLIKLYKNNCNKFDSRIKPTPFYKPFFHLNSDGIWSFRMNEGYSVHSFSQTPSLKWQKEAIKYAYFCDPLFGLIHNFNEREKLKEELISHYFQCKL